MECLSAKLKDELTMEEKVVVNQELCTSCKACIEICPRDCFELNSEKKSIYIPNPRCHDCGHCVSICPEQAISHKSLPDEDYGFINEKFTLPANFGDQMYYFMKSIRSTRKFLNKPIENEILEKLVDVTRYSATGHHSQNVEITLIHKPETITLLKKESEKTIIDFLKKIDNPFYRFIAKLIGKGSTIRKAQGTRPRFQRMLDGFRSGKADYLFHGAPAVFVFHCHKDGYVPEDNCNIAAANIRILAQSYGLGSCYIGYLTYYAKYNSKILEILNIPADNQIYQVLIVGYPKHKFKTFVSRNPAKIQWV